MLYFGIGILFWSVIFFLLYTMRPASRLHEIKISALTKSDKLICIAVLIVNILLVTIPMGWCPAWNGDIPTHHEQYEKLAQSFLKGQLFLDVDVDERLLAMPNPYDPAARENLNVHFEWDHAFFNGRYYVYFGVVPAVLLFVLLFHSQKFFPRMPLSVYLTLSAALSLISISYCAAYPSLYCTAISAGLCLEIWSIYFFLKVLWEENSRKISYVIFGAILGGLTFGCRPTIALANILVLIFLPSLIKIFRGRIWQLFFALTIPYMIIGAGLAIYNYARFENFFEFGQAYQLTVADQHFYGKNFLQFDFLRQLNGLLENFFGVYLTDNFRLSKYADSSGAFVNYPILILPAFLLMKKFRQTLSAANLGNLILALIFLPILITAIQIQWAPFANERYLLDFYWLMALSTFVAAGFLPVNRKITCAICFAALAMIFQSARIFLTPNDLNLTAFYPELLPKIWNVILFQ